jgi:hypothetical protein
MDDKQKVGAGRRRNAAIAAVVVLATLAVVVWQTWEYWMPPDEAMTQIPPANDSAGRPGAPPGGFGGPPGGGMPGPDEMRRRFSDQVKSALAASDAEWETLRPKVERVTQIQDQLRPRPGFGPGGPAPQPGSPSDAADFSEKTEMLRAAVDDEKTTPDALAANLSAARESKKKLEAELKSAREDLRKQLTPRQEAALAVLGVLD